MSTLREFEHHFSGLAVRWMVDYLNDKLGFAPDFIEYTETGTRITFDKDQTATVALDEFARAPRLALVFGNVPGHCFIRFEHMKDLLTHYDPAEIADASSLLSAFRERGYTIERIAYVPEASPRRSEP